MRVVPRLAALALLASLFFAAPASAADSPPPECTEECQAPEGGGGHDPEVAGGDGSDGDLDSGDGSVLGSPLDGLLPKGRCDVITPTGSQHIYVSVNPVLGLYTIQTECITRYTKGIVTIGHIGP